MLERLSRHTAAFDGYTELRLHNNYTTSIQIQNGNLTNNETNTTEGISARCYRHGV